MDELIDILDSNGKSTGKIELKSYAHRMGLFHATVHIWFYTSDGKILIQLRGKNKKTFPLHWDVSVAGHTGAAETVELSALREVEEEIGLSISDEELEKIGVFKSVQKHREDLVDCEFHHTFLCELKVRLETLRKQESEIENLRLISLLKFSNETLKVTSGRKYVPHSTEYYTTVIKAIEERL